MAIPLLILIFSSIFGSYYTDGKYIEGHLLTAEDWHFLARFCFLSDKGRLEFEFEFPQEYAPQNILLYYDEPSQWPAVYKSDKNCYQREATLRPENNQIVYLTLAHYWSGCTLNETKQLFPTMVCRGRRTFRSSRERWWFVAASNCPGDKNCTQKKAALNPANNQVIRLNTRFYWSGCRITEDALSGFTIYRCSAGRTFRSSRERWWFFAAESCGSSKSCVERESPPHINPRSNQIITLAVDQAYSGCEYVYKTYSGVQNITTIWCGSSRNFRSLRERWWFIAASRCAGTNGLNLKYKITMTNGNDLLHKHFSADEFYILPIDIAFLIGIFIIFCFSIAVACVLRNRQLFHTTYKMYMTSLVFELFHLLIMSIAYGKYANDGLENYGLLSFGRAFEAASILTFLLMVILMGKGYTITRGRLSTSGSIKIAIFMTLYAITYAVLFIYESQFFDPGEVLYLYESPPGYGLIALRMIGWIWFCYAVFFTLKHYPEKARFYFPFFIFYTIWFLAMPIFVGIAFYALDKWAREKIIVSIMNVVSLIGHIVFLILTRPSAANSNFPYHVRTTQIGIMGSAQDGVPMTACKETESFSPHPYAPSSNMSVEMSTNGGPNFTELFTVSNTRSAQPVGMRGSESSQPNNNNTNPMSNNGTIDRFPHDGKPNPFIVTK